MVANRAWWRDEELGMKSYNLLDLKSSVVLKYLITPPSHLSDQPVIPSIVILRIVLEFSRC